MSNGYASFADLFRTATGGYAPFPYQEDLAQADPFPALLHAPTGAGKTEAAVLAWLWRRRFHPDPQVRSVTPRRLVYCLPMRVLVEQTHQRITNLLRRLNLDTGRDGVGVFLLMGGGLEEDWERSPEADVILVGTQDMLLSRALNRGYAMSRYRWPVDFGLLNNDVLWVVDEVQLMGAGLPTTAQLQALRRRLGVWGTSHTLWMSATLHPEELATVDYAPDLAQAGRMELTDADRADPNLRRRLGARKALHRLQHQDAQGSEVEPEELARQVLQRHVPGTLTLVVVNRVRRAQETFKALDKLLRRRGEASPEVWLVHSRFRPCERRPLEERLAEAVDADGPGRIVVATQVVEAGLDLSARVLFTDLAPWSSFVQRCGRCNRRGEYDEADVFWVDLDLEKENRGKPYDAVELAAARQLLGNLSDVGPDSLRGVDPSGKGERDSTAVLRCRDLLELFDTTPDLAGADVDVADFVRGSASPDVYLFWRDFQGDPDEPAPERRELCPVPVYELGELVKKDKVESWVWDPLERTREREGSWVPVRPANAQRIYPGQEFLLRAVAGRYSARTGWDPTVPEPVPMPGLRQPADRRPDSFGHDPRSLGESSFVSVARHTDAVVGQVARLKRQMGGAALPEELLLAARWHDAGKAHPVFQESMVQGVEGQVPPQGGPWAKSPGRGRHSRPFFRHELASALAALQNGQPDLVAYLAAAHHGKVRMVIRQLPRERRPKEATARFALGVWEGEELPQADLGGGVDLPRSVLDLRVMEMGEGPAGASWQERALRLLDRWGPFQLAYLEAVLRIADWLASAEEKGGGADA
ncbi:MAG: CRISPR-associated endonuclease Cas3'' [Thermaerobacter sp.]|nr:CRISPR-associated endonuclease Cas3'' [Thermaerobacter sp.]